MAYRTSRRVRGTNGQVITVHIIDSLADLPAAATQAPGNEAHGILGSDDGKVWRAQKLAAGMTWVEQLTSRSIASGLTVGGSVAFSVDDTARAAYTTAQTLSHTTSDGSFGGAGIGVRVNLKVENGSGDAVSAGMFGAKLVSVTAGSELGALEMLPASAGTPVATGCGFSVIAQSASNQNGVSLTLSPGTDPVYFKAFGSGAAIPLRIQAKGAAAVEIRKSDDTATLIAAGATGLGFFGAAEVAQQAQQSALTLTSTGNFAVPAEPTAAEIVTRMNLLENRCNALSTALRNLGFIAT